MKQAALALRLRIQSLFNPRCDFLLPSLMLNGNKMEVVAEIFKQHHELPVAYLEDSPYCWLSADRR